MLNLNKNVVAISLVSFFTDFSSSMVTTILPLFIVYILKEDVDKLGYITGIATFTSYIFRILFGYLSDKYNKTKPFLIFGYSISTFTKPLFAFSHSWKDIALLRSIERLGKAIRSAPKDVLISFYSKKESGKAFGFQKMLDMAGNMFGALSVFLILYFFGKTENIFKSIFLLTIIPGLIALLILLFFVEDIKKDKKEKRKKISLKEENYFIYLILFSYFFSMFFMLKKPFFIVKAKDFIDITYIPLLVILLYFIQSISSYIFGVSIDKYGWAPFFILSLVFGILSIIFLSFGKIIFAFVFLALFLIASTNSIKVFISKHSKNKGIIFGIFYAGTAIFSSLGAIVTGIIWKNFGFKMATKFSIFGLIFTLFFSIFVLRFFIIKNKLEVNHE